MRVTVSTPGLLALRRDLIAVRKAGLGRDLGRELRKAVKPLKPAVSAEAATTLPKRGGYNVTMSRSVKTRATVRENRLDALVAVTVFAGGRKERRDIIKIDQGVLRHPVYGRSRRLRRGPRAGTRIPNPWAVTRVKPGFATRPIDRLGPAVGKAGREVVDDLIKQLKG